MRSHGAAVPTTNDPPCILLAEDDIEMRELVAAALRGDGYDVTEVSDGGRLLMRIGRTYLSGTSDLAYDMVISDIRMPVCNGLKILEGLRAARWSTPVILMTAFGDRSTRSRVEKLGAILLDKPFDLDDLRTAVLNLVPITAPATHRSTRLESADDDEDDEEERGREVTLTIVATFANPAEAILAKERLEGAGVEAHVAGEMTAGVMPYLSLAMGGVTLYVADTDVQRAREILMPTGREC